MECRRRDRGYDLWFFDALIPHRMRLDSWATSLHATPAAVRGDLVDVFRVEVVVVLLAPDLDEPLGRLAPAAHELEPRRAAEFVGWAFAPAGAAVLADAAAVAHEVDAHHLGVLLVLAAAGFLLRAAGLDQDIALRDGVFLHATVGVGAGFVGAEHEGWSDLGHLEGGDRLYEGCAELFSWRVWGSVLVAVLAVVPAIVYAVVPLSIRSVRVGVRVVFYLFDAIVLHYGVIL